MIFPVFSDFLFEYDFAENEINNNILIDFAYKQYNFDKEGRTYSNIGGWQSKDIDPNSLELDQLFDFINKQSFEFHKALLIRPELEFFIDKVWININKKGHYNLPHSHFDSFLTGIYYIQIPKTNDNLSGNIVFNNVNTHKLLYDESVIDCLNMYTATNLRLETYTGKLLIFQAHMQHFVEPNSTDNDRISLAFDMKLRTKRT